MIADILGDRMGVLSNPASTKSSLYKGAADCDSQPTRSSKARRRWWNQTVYAAFRGTGTIFCSCSGPGLPDELVRTADDVYLRLHGPKRWYRHGTAFCESSADWPEGGQRACRLMNGTCKRMTFAHARLK
jgi:hypothetical protein